MKIRPNDPKTSWLNHQRVDFIKGFYTSRHILIKLFHEYEEFDIIPHETIDCLLEPHLRQVKDLSHVLYRTRGDNNVTRKQQRLFDKVLGEMFHELGKSRDNIRLLEVYTTKVNETDDKMTRVLNRLDEQVLNSARRDLPIQLRRAKRILNQLVPLFERILPVYRNNEVIIRTLYFARKDYDRLCEPSTVEYFFPLIFNSVADGYLNIIRSLIKTKHISHAQTALDEFQTWVNSHPKFKPIFKQAKSELKTWQK